MKFFRFVLRAATGVRQISVNSANCSSKQLVRDVGYPHFPLIPDLDNRATGRPLPTSTAQAPSRAVVVSQRSPFPKVSARVRSGYLSSLWPAPDPVVQRSRTLAFQAGNAGSNPVGVTTQLHQRFKPKSGLEPPPHRRSPLQPPVPTAAHQT